MLTCSVITGELMQDPALLGANYYEYSAIKKWVMEKGTDPMDPSNKVSIRQISRDEEMRRLCYKYRYG
jgi:hypothetical protein